MSDRTPHLNRLLIFIIIILCLICGLLFTQSSAGPFHDNGIAAQAKRVVRIMDGKIESDMINEEFVEEA